MISLFVYMIAFCIMEMQGLIDKDTFQPPTAHFTERDSFGIGTCCTVIYEQRGNTSFTGSFGIQNIFQQSVSSISDTTPSESFILNNSTGGVLRNDQNTDITTNTYQAQNGFNISNNDLIKCINSGKSISVSADQGTVHLSHEHIMKGVDDSKWAESTDLYCRIDVQSGNGYQLYVQYTVREFQELCNSTNVLVPLFIDVIDWTPFRQPTVLNRFHYCHQWQPSVFYTSQNAISIVILVRFGSVYLPALVMDIQTIAEVSRPRLEVGYITPQQGYIQSPRFFRELEDIPVFEDWTEITVPRDHVIMISFQRNVPPTFCEMLSLSVEGVGETQSFLIWRSCALDLPRVGVYKTSKIRVEFTNKIGYYHMKIKFRILFTFHNIGSVPERLLNNKWNCSVADFDSFKGHVMCNIERECENGEDEAMCSYISNVCGEKITYRRKCYEMIRPNKPTSWTDASSHCKTIGGYLASFNTIDEWQAIVEIISMSRLEYNIYVGLTFKTFSRLPEIYRDVWVWADNSVAYFTDHLTSTYEYSITRSGLCAFIPAFAAYRSLEMQECYQATDHICALCEISGSDKIDTEQSNLEPNSSIHLFAKPAWLANISSTVCSDGYRTHTFLACDGTSACLTAIALSPCDLSTDILPAFACDSQLQAVPYSLVCDSEYDCHDGSDEVFCAITSCRPGYKKCLDGQCVLQSHFCNGRKECADASDEIFCVSRYVPITTRKLFPPAIVHFRREGLELQHWNNSEPCPETHFPCPGSQYCMPVFVRCNGVFDCPGHEDEDECDQYSCPGFYRCRASRVCLHSSHVCDDLFQCPQHDDEMMCQLICPDNCTCSGLAFKCTGYFRAFDYLDLRYLDARNSKVDPRELIGNRMLAYLNLANCNLEAIPNVVFPNLKILDLSQNKIVTLNPSALQKLGNIKVLRVAENPLVLRPIEATYYPLQSLDIAFVSIKEFYTDFLKEFPNLNTLNLSFSKIDKLTGQWYVYVSKLKTIDLRGNPISEFSEKTFKNLRYLEYVYTDNFKLCCQVALPDGFKGENCFTPRNELSSCDDLLRATEYRICLWLFASLVIGGNAGSFIFRTLFHRGIWRNGYSIFVTNLSVADLLTGVYLAIVGAADLVYRGNYVWFDTLWRHSALCHFAGFLFFLSNEVSSFIICLITVDRFMVLHFPFSRMRFGKWSALSACAVTWLLGLSLAVVPFFPGIAHWEFYSQTGICIPLPVTRATFPGRPYSFGVMIVLNVLLFLLVALGQAAIYLSIRRNMMTSDTTRKSNDSIIAHRLLSVVISNFLCWCPVGLVAFLSSAGIPVPGEINVGMVIFVLPLNSALNPSLYTLNILRERRNKVHEARLRERIKNKSTSSYQISRSDSTI